LGHQQLLLQGYLAPASALVPAALCTIICSQHFIAG